MIPSRVTEIERPNGIFYSWTYKVKTQSYHLQMRQFYCKVSDIRENENKNHNLISHLFERFESFLMNKYLYTKESHACLVLISFIPYIFIPYIFHSFLISFKIIFSF